MTIRLAWSITMLEPTLFYLPGDWPFLGEVFYGTLRGLGGVFMPERWCIEKHNEKPLSMR